MKQKLFGLLLILSLAMICLLIKCDNSPSKPVEPESDYDIYLREFGEEGKFFVFNAKRLAIVDSFDIPHLASWPKLSADGKYMFFPDTALSIIDMETKQRVAQVDVPGDFMEVSPDNKYLAFFHNSLHIVDASTFKEVFTDTGAIGPGKFSLDGKRLYCPKHGTDIYCLNLDTVPFTARIIDYPLAKSMNMVASKDEKHLFILAGASGLGTRLFQVFDMALDSIIFSLTLPSNFSSGTIDITNDGNYVVFADGESNGGFEPLPASRNVFIFNVNSFALTIVPTYGVDPAFPNGLPAYFFVLTPDSKWFVSGGMGIIAINLDSKRVAKLFEFPDRYLQGITCRKIKK